MNLTDFLCLRATYQNRPFQQREFETDIIGSSDCNIFIPVYSLYSHYLLVINGDFRIIEYSLPSSNERYPFRQYSELIRQFQNTEIVTNYTFKLQNNNYTIHIHRGIIFDQNYNVLACLAVDSNYLLNHNSLEDLANNPNKDKFVIFIGSEFNNPIYKNVRKNFEILYLSKAKEIGIDVIETSKINDWLFKNNLKKPTFKNVLEMNKHLKKEIPMCLIKD